VTPSLYYHPAQVGRLAGIGSGAAELSVPLPVEKRKRFVYVPHCPGGPGLDCPLVVDPTGVYFRQGVASSPKSRPHNPKKCAEKNNADCTEFSPKLYSYSMMSEKFISEFPSTCFLEKQVDIGFMYIFFNIPERINFFLKGIFLIFYFYVRYLTLLHLLPLRFHCVGGCWDRTQDCCDFGIDDQAL
jgi:hypothetical protein